jgi:hypothetical protein
MNHGREARVGLAGAHCNTFEFFEFAEEVPDQVAPFVEVDIDVTRRTSVRMLRDHDLRAAPAGLFGDPVDVEGLVRDQAAERGGVDQLCRADRVMALTGQEVEAHEVTQRIGERHDLGGDPAARDAYGLALSPPLEPCPWR